MEGKLNLGDNVSPPHLVFVINHTPTTYKTKGGHQDEIKVVNTVTVMVSVKYRLKYS